MRTKLIIILIGLFLTGCGTKKKLTERERKVNRLEAAGFKTSIKSKKLETIALKSFKKTFKTDLKYLNENIVADSSGIVTVTHEETPTGFKRTYTGVKSLEIESGQKSEEETQKDSLVDQIDEEFEASYNEGFKVDSNSDESSRSADVSILRVSTWLWVLLIVAAVLFLVLWRLKKPPSFFQ